MVCVLVKNFKVMLINFVSIEWIMGFDCYVCLYKKNNIKICCRFYLIYFCLSFLNIVFEYLR